MDATVAPVRGGNDPPFDHSVVARGADLGLRWRATTREDDAAYDIEVTPQRKLDLESRGLGFGGARGLGRSFVRLTARAPLRQRATLAV